MAKHTLTRSADAQGFRRRYYVDGRRVAFAVWFELDRRSSRQDSFQTVRRGTRYLHSKVVTMGRAF